MNTEWELSLFEIGELQTCVLSYIFAPCAIAYARNQLDESPILFNLFCTSICTNRWLVRTAYGINGEAETDALYSILFYPCVANQTLQTSIIRKNPTSNGGRQYNLGRWQVPAISFFEDKSSWDSNMFFSVLCAPCAVGSLLERTIGMPFWFGALFVCFPWTARNLFRYQYRIAGNDMIEECLYPSIWIMGCSVISTHCLPHSCEICSPCLKIMPSGLFTSHMLLEANIRGSSIMAPEYLLNPTAIVVNREDANDGLIDRQDDYSDLPKAEDDEAHQASKLSSYGAAK